MVLARAINLEILEAQMLSWLAKQVISRVMARTRAGDIGPTLMLDADDVHFVFPGDNSWSGDYSGKAEHRAWLERLVRVGVKTEPDEVAAAGFPWKMTVCIRGRSWLDSPEGERIYANRFVIWGTLRWGKLRDYEVYEDTQKAKALDGWLEHNEERLALAGTR
jgi:ketosteroid isomerase-like protein